MLLYEYVITFIFILDDNISIFIFILDDNISILQQIKFLFAKSFLDKTRLQIQGKSIIKSLYVGDFLEYFTYISDKIYDRCLNFDWKILQCARSA